MAQERYGDPVLANNLFEGLVWGDPNVDLDTIREEYRLVARDEARRHPNRADVRLWSAYPMAIARCLVMKIDPESGDDVEDPISLVDRYRSRGPGFYSEVMSQYEGLMNQYEPVSKVQLGSI